ncbi:DUF3531 family protein [Prochlorococcus sp. MIT 1300]|uniref:DUF3531 family protein n=1 Tax=Prochlorococcus sp. MIT 1300 TaxID=3096218 RepID=UPI002A74D47F|nr:DUF3531 family protein [Prochlorococcus sp. MIT 1300]
MEVCFREVDPFNCWIWLQFNEVPSEGEKNYIDGIFDSWYVLGRLGGFNAENLQAHHEGIEISGMAYDNNEANKAMPALMHNIGELEYQRNWARCWVDLGTSDAMAIDVLINSLIQVDESVVQLKQVCVGGVNTDWPIVEHPDALFQMDR